MQAVASAATITILLVLAGCGAPDEEDLGLPDFSGVIMDVCHADGIGIILGTVFIEASAPASAVQYDKALITVNIDTHILRREDDQTHPATFEDLEFGERVDVWFTGPGEYYPVEATARQLVLHGKVVE